MTATTYAYKVKDRAGRLREGTLEADSEELVVARLRDMGFVPLSISAESRSMLKSEIKLRREKVSPKDVAVFSRQLTTMISAGLPITRALAILVKQTDAPALAEVVNVLKADIERGLSFSQAIAKHPKVFPPVYLAMVRAGESGGVLDAVLERLADSLEKQLELRGKIKSAMTYPITVAVIVVAIVTAMLMFVVPMFEGMYANLGGTLPAPTRLLISASNLLKSTWYLIALAIVGAVVGLRRWSATEPGRLAIDRAKLRVPIFGRLIGKAAIARVTRTLGSLVRSGVAIMEALDIVADAAGNAVVAGAILDARERVALGEPLAASLAAHPVLPPMVVQMMAVGEETGALDDMLDKIATFYEREVDATVSALTSLIEPLLMVLMGITVGGMVVALYLPMFNIINLVK
jgi:type IV pilus assembly protein PilC